MLKDCNYDKIRLLAELSKIVWFIENHAKKDAEKENHPLCYAMYDELQKDLEKHMEKLRLAIEGLSKEGKLK